MSGEDVTQAYAGASALRRELWIRSLKPGSCVEVPRDVWSNTAHLQRFLEEINRYQRKPREQAEQDQQWRDLTGL